jgi:hypothetical protein
MTDWIVWYDDQSSFSSDDGEAHEAPTEGFVCALGYDQDGERYIQNGWDFYHYDKETQTWWGCDRYGLHDRLRRNAIYAYKEGRTVSKLRFQEIMALAKNHPNFPMQRPYMARSKPCGDRP